MAEVDEWTRKGAVLSDETAQKEYGVSRDFIVKGVQAGQLDYRQGSAWGNPWFRFLRSQLECYIEAQLGAEYLANIKVRAELRAVSKTIVGLKRKLAGLEARKGELERVVTISPTPERN